MRAAALLAVPLLACAAYRGQGAPMPAPEGGARIVESKVWATVIGWATLRWRPVGGVTFGSTIIVYPTADSTIVQHELEHVKQWGRYGWRFPFLYLWESLFAPGNRFEEAADSACTAYWTQRGLVPGQMACGAGP